MKIPNLKTYLYSPQKCFIPICKARCCGDAPLPEDFLLKNESAIKRNVYGAVNIGKNDLGDNFDSVVYNTRPVPLIMIANAGKGNRVYYYDNKFAQHLNIKSRNEATDMLREMEAKGYYNYCPFLNEHGRCAVYNIRPQICREFGTSPLPINRCPDKASRMDIIKFVLKEFSFVKFFKNLTYAIKSKYAKA